MSRIWWFSANLNGAHEGCPKTSDLSVIDRSLISIYLTYFMEFSGKSQSESQGWTAAAKACLGIEPAAGHTGRRCLGRGVKELRAAVDRVKKARPALFAWLEANSGSLLKTGLARYSDQALDMAALNTRSLTTRLIAYEVFFFSREKEQAMYHRKIADYMPGQNMDRARKIFTRILEWAGVECAPGSEAIFRAPSKNSEAELQAKLDATEAKLKAALTEIERLKEWQAKAVEFLKSQKAETAPVEVAPAPKARPFDLAKAVPGSWQKAMDLHGPLKVFAEAAAGNIAEERYLDLAVRVYTQIAEIVRREPLTEEDLRRLSARLTATGHNMEKLYADLSSVTSADAAEVFSAWQDQPAF